MLFLFVALYRNLSRFTGLNKTWEVLSTKVELWAASQAGSKEHLKSMACEFFFAQKQVECRVWISLPDVPTKVDLHVHQVTCLKIDFAINIPFETALVSAITKNASV